MTLNADEDYRELRTIRGVEVTTKAGNYSKKRLI